MYWNKIAGRRSLVGCSPWGREGSDTTERLHFHFSLSCIGEGNGNPLQCFCLENPRDGKAWWAAVYGVAQSRTRLKRLSSSSSSSLKEWIPSAATGQTRSNCGQQRFSKSVLVRLEAKKKKVSFLLVAAAQSQRHLSRDAQLGHICYKQESFYRSRNIFNVADNLRLFSPKIHTKVFISK